jgi:hypothetical protein
MTFRRTNLPTLSEVSEWLDYDPATGVLRWKKSRGPRAAGAVAGCVGSKGYLYVRILGHAFGVHQVAWLFKTGDWQPLGTVVDHRNENILDNRADNLRIATPAQNQWNSTKVPMRGVNRLPSGKWKATITYYKRLIFLGSYPTKDIAKNTRDCVGRILYGDFATEAAEKVAA